MKKKIVAFTLAISTIFMCCAFTATGIGFEEEIPEVVEVIEESFRVERIEVFEDKNLENYTQEQLQALIDEQVAIQQEAHKLAESARKLGWSEDSETIYSAGSEWWNAQKAIDVYRAQKEKLIAIEKAEWEARKAKYPAATEIWLYMKELGWNDYVCAGIMGNLMAEVGGQTLNIQYWLRGNGYYGMCQWSRGYSKVWGADLATQCDFLRDTIKYELDTFGYAYAKGFNYNSFLNMSNEREVAKAFAKCYERCGSSTYTIRQNNATRAYEYFVN